jgi:hypothetical protein
MATRTAGTGVLITLVTFVIATVGLLVVCIVQFSGSEKARSEARDLRSKLAQQADAGQKLSVLHEAIASQLTGGSDAALDQDKFNSAMSELGVPAGGSVKAYIDSLKGKLASAEKSAAGLQRQIDELKAQLQPAAASGEGETPTETAGQASTSIAQLNEAAEGYRRDLEEVKKSSDEVRTNFEQRFNAYKQERDAEAEQLKGSKATLETRLAEANRKLAQFETQPSDPSLLVDGNVISVGGGDGTVFIDLGRSHRVQPGMTFEVFATADQIRTSSEQGLRGKATLQIMKVGDDTSTARVVRSSPGKPVVRGDVLANAVYSPSQRFRFLVHGKFDLDGDGRTSTDEANVIRNRIREWGGILAESDRVTGDLDFVVIGSRPKRPGKPLPDADEAELNAFTEAQDACDLYEKIEREATEARIPVLNLNRFEALTGMTN